MGESVLDGCSDNCGWAAAILCVIAFGSFGVPIKTSPKVDVDPFILQSYKTIVCFVTSFFVLFLGEELRWSNWGLASGLFWVPGACCGIYGIRNAGMAVAGPYHNYVPFVAECIETGWLLIKCVSHVLICPILLVISANSGNMVFHYRLNEFYLWNCRLSRKSEKLLLHLRCLFGPDHRAHRNVQIRRRTSR